MMGLRNSSFAPRGFRVLIIFAAATLFPPVTRAAVIPLGNSGWEAIFDAGLDPFVNIVVNSEDSQAVFIQKFATFTQPPQNGMFSPILISFRQTRTGAVPFIVLNDETITNSTGSVWLDFHMDIAAGGAAFDPVRTLNSGGPAPIGYAIAPFTNAAFSDGNTALDIDGGPGIPAGGVWTPGAGPSGGQLWIAANPSAAEPFTLFTLKEVPTIPEPSSLMMAALGALILKRRAR